MPPATCSCAVRGPRRPDRGPGAPVADLHPPRHGRRGGRADRRAADRPRPARAADRRPAPDPARGHRVAPASYGFPRGAPPDVVLPRGAGPHARPGLRQPLPHREVGWRGLHETDESIAEALAAAAGVAIENATLYEESEGRRAWLAATAEIAALLSADTPVGEALQVVADRARSLSHADVAWVVTGSTAESCASRCPRCARRPRGDAGAPDAELAGERRDRLRRAVDRPGPLARPARRRPVLDPRVAAARAGHRAAAHVGHHGRGGAVAGVDAGARRPLPPGRPGPAGQLRRAGGARSPARPEQGGPPAASTRTATDRARPPRPRHPAPVRRRDGAAGHRQAADLDDRVRERLADAIDELDDTIKDIRRTIFALGSLGEDSNLQTEVETLVERAGSVMKLNPKLRLQGPVRSTVPTRWCPTCSRCWGRP